MEDSLACYCVRTGMDGLLRQWLAGKNLPLTPQEISAGSNRASLFPQLVKEWHHFRNAPLAPGQLLPGSHRLVWWRCEKGHEWQATVRSRTGGSGCPVCSRRAVLAGSNDLASTRPDLAAQWHPAKNRGLTPQDVTEGAGRKVWWRCEKGHEWQASISSRARDGAGCPVCSGRVVLAGENDLASLFPAVAAQWHPQRNGALTPDKVSPYSNRKVFWRCGLGHEYPMVIADRTSRGSGCPYCAGRKVLPGFNDLATAAPRVAAQWHPELNGALTARMVTAGSRKKVWWQCPAGHVWKAAVYSRTGARGTGCPVCAGTVRSRPPGFGREAAGMAIPMLANGRAVR